MDYRECKYLESDGVCGADLLPSNKTGYCQTHQWKMDRKFPGKKRRSSFLRKPPGPRLDQVHRANVCRDPLPAQPKNPAGILAAVCAVFQVTSEQVKGSVLGKDDLPRMIASYLLREDLVLPYKLIASFLEYPRFHQVQHAYERVGKMSVVSEVEEILQLIRRQYQTPTA